LARSNSFGQWCVTIHSLQLIIGGVRVRCQS